MLAVGSRNPDNTKTELYNYDTGRWSRSADYPFGIGPYVYNHDMLFIEELSAYFLIGGRTYRTLATIAKFADGVWSPAGELNSARDVSFSF